MRWGRGIMFAVATAVLLAPASAHATLGWYDADPDQAIPATVKLNDVATYGPDLVVAVGRETVTQTDGTTVDRPAVYRLWRGVWNHDTIAGVSGAGELVDVAVDGAGFWAVGTQGGAPLLANLVASPTQVPDGPASWAAIAAPGGENPMGPPRSVALGGPGGLIGDASGKLWQIAGGIRPVTSTNTAPVNGVAFNDAGGIAATGATSTDPRIFSVNATTSVASPATALPATEAPPLVALAGRAASALGVDSGAYWMPNAQGVWQRRTSGLNTPGLQLVDVSLGEQNISALAGNVTTATGTEGYVLRGTVGNWRPELVSGGPINGVAAYRPNGIWAVGDGGTVLHYWDKPPLTCISGCDGSTGTETGTGSGGETSSGGGGVTSDYGPTTTTSGNTQTTVIPAERKGDPTIFIVEPKRPATKNRKPRRLLDRVKVLRRAKPKRLIITFRLRARARVAIAAKRGRRVVSRSRSRAMRPGRRRVVLPFKGSPPNQLRIVVRPLRAKRAR